VFIGFFVCLGYTLQNIDCVGRGDVHSAWNIPAICTVHGASQRCAQCMEHPSDVHITWSVSAMSRPRTLHTAGCVERKTACVSEACVFFLSLELVLTTKGGRQPCDLTAELDPECSCTLCVNCCL